MKFRLNKYLDKFADYEVIGNQLAANTGIWGGFLITLSRASESAERVCRDTASLFLKFRKCGLIPILLGPIAVPLTLISTAVLVAQNIDGIPQDWRDHVRWIILGALLVLIFCRSA